MLHRTMYCDRLHRLDDGVPVDHRCRILDPAYLRAERDGEIDVAVDLLERMPLELHPGEAEARSAAPCAG